MTYDQDGLRAEDVLGIRGGEERVRLDHAEQHDQRQPGRGEREALRGRHRNDARRGARGGLAALGDPRRGQLGTGELAADGALAEHEHPVAQQGELVVIAAGAQRRDAVARERGERGRDPGASTHVDAAGRLIEEQQPRTCVNPLGEQRLLLVAAAELAEQDRRIRGAHIVAGEQCGGVAIHLSPVQSMAAGVAAEHGEGDVGADGQRRDATIARTVSRHQRDAGRDRPRGAHVSEVEDPPEREPSAPSRERTVYEVGNLVEARAD